MPDKVERYISRQKNLMAINELCVQLDIELHTISALERHELGVKKLEESGEGEPYRCLQRFDASGAFIFRRHH